jgi:hypothetical protein
MDGLNRPRDNPPMGRYKGRRALWQVFTRILQAGLFCQLAELVSLVHV